MALVRHDFGEVQFKIVYYGPSGSGKSTSLSYIHKRLDPLHRGECKVLAEQGGNILQFDFLPTWLPDLSGYRVRFQLCEGNKRTLDSFLNDADGVVFVADSALGSEARNLEAHEFLREGMAKTILPVREIPRIYQFNKRDVVDSIRPEELDDLMSVTTPSFLACALSGSQVFATLDHATKTILKGFERSIVQESMPVEAAPPRETAKVETLT